MENLHMANIDDLYIANTKTKSQMINFNFAPNLKILNLINIIEAAKTETAKTETAKTEAAKTETAKTEAAKIEVTTPDAAKTETAKTETAKTETV
jgi:hypothetical protein